MTQSQSRPPIDLSSVRWTHRVAILSGLIAILVIAFLALNQTRPWLLIFLVAIAFLGTDGVLRSHPSGRFRSIADTSPHLFIPVLLPLAASLFFDRLIHGYWSLLAGLVTALLFGSVVYGEYRSLDPEWPGYAFARFLVNVGAYLTAFALYIIIYAFELAVPAAAITVALSSLLLSVEILREGEEEPVRVIGMAAVIGVILGETRWVLHFLPLATFVAAVTLLVAFYLTTGLLHSYLIGHLDRATIIEFAIVAASGLAIIIAAQLAGVGG